MEIATTIILALIILLMYWFIRRRDNHGMKILPGPKGYPLIGNGLEVDPKRLHHQLSNWAKTYGSIFEINLFGKRIISINDSETARKAFTSQEYGKMFNDRPSTFLGKYVLFDYSEVGVRSMDKLTVKLRKAVSQALHTYGAGVKDFEKIVQKEMNQLICKIREQEGQDTSPEELISVSFANILSMLLTGEEPIPGDAEMIWQFNYVVNKFINPAFDLIISTFPILRLLPGPYGRVYSEMVDIREKVLQRFYQKNKDSFIPGKYRGCVDVFFQMQIDENNKDLDHYRISDNNVRCLVINMIFASLLTTRNGILSWLFILLNNEACAKKIQQEVDEVVGRERLPMIEDKGKMPYTEAALIEALRYVTHVPTSLIHVPKEEVNFDGYLIKKKTNILLNIWHIHHNEALWGDPWVYRPERFLDATGNILPQEHKLRQNILTFSVGRRNCIGEFMAKSRMFLFITTLLQNFDLKHPKGDGLTDPDPRKYKPGMILQPHEFKCQFVPRK